MEDLDTIEGRDGALDALLKAKDEGLIRGLGFSSHRPPELYLEAIKRLPLSVILIWDNYLEEQWFPRSSSRSIRWRARRAWASRR